MNTRAQFSMQEAFEALSGWRDPQVIRDPNIKHSIALYKVGVRSNSKRVPFVSGMGRLGLAPYQIMPGDDIYIILGSPVALILCYVGLEYRIVGEAYVTGIVDGEIMDTNPHVETLVIV